MPNEEPAQPESLSDYGYTAFETWEYRPFVYVLEQKKAWVVYGESFYRASELIIDNLARGRGFPEIEGLAGVFLFRHYLELALKKIITRGRLLAGRDRNAAWEDIKTVDKIHSLAKLWELVLLDAKSKLEARIWGSYDIPFVEKCIAEFHERDEKGFAFRYPQQGGERYDFNFGDFRQAMEHVYQILENMTVCLIEQHGENEEWIEIQNSF